MQESLNVRLLLRLVLGAALFGVCYSVVYVIQVHRHGRDLLAQISRCEQEGQLDRALRFLNIYLSFVPDDADARARAGLLMEQSNPSAQGKLKIIEVYQTVLFHDHERNDIRRRLVRLLLEAGEVDEAVEHLKVLREALPDDGELDYQMGVCNLVKASYKEAADLFRSAIQHEPTRLESYLELAMVLRQHLRKPEEADTQLENMIGANKHSVQAYLARAAVREQQATLPGTTPDAARNLLHGAAQDVTEALRLAPSEPEALLLAGEVVQQQGDLKAARDYFQRGIKQRPRDGRFYQAWAALEFKAGKAREAETQLRQGLKQIPEAVELLWSLGVLLLEQGDLAEAREVITRLSKTDLAPARLHYLSATLRLKEGMWFEARAAYEAVRPQLASWPELTTQCDLYLGRCYEQTAAYDQQLIAYRRATAGAPLSVQARFGAAVALMRMGRRDDALAEFQELMSFPNPPVEGWPILAQLMIVRNLATAQRPHDWRKVDQILDKAAQAAPESVEVQILRAEVLVAQGKVADARKLLEKTAANQPRRADVWVALAGLIARQGQAEAALDLLDQAERTQVDVVPLRLARLRIVLGRSTPDTAQSLKEIARGLEKLSEDNRVTILGELAEAYFALDQAGEAERIWKQIAEMRPADLYVRVRLFELAQRSGDEPAMKTLMEEIRRREGSQAAVARYLEAQYLLWRARQGETDHLERARNLMAEVAILRPNWPAVPLCRAQINELEAEQKRLSGDSAGAAGLLNQAIDNYLRALKTGEQRLDTVRRVVQLLNDRGRYLEADEIIRNLSEQSPVSADLQRLVAESSIRAKDYPRALEAAKKAVAGSKDYRDFIWLGEMYTAAGQLPLAEQEFRGAVKLAENRPEPWVALVQFLARTSQKGKAEEMVSQAQSKLAKDQALLALAQCYEVLGKLDQAKALYEQARAAYPDDSSTLRSVSSFYLRSGQIKEAESTLRKMVELKSQWPAEADWARRTLGVLLAALGNHQQIKEALALLGMLQGGAEPPVALSPEDMQARALALSAQPGLEQRLQAIRLWEGLNDRQTLTAKDQFLLAGLYEFTGNWPKSRAQMLKLLALDGDDPQFLAFFVDGLLRHKELSEAERWLDKIQSLPNQGALLPTVALKARLLAAREQVDQVLRVFRTYVEDRTATPPKETDRLKLVAQFLYKELAESFPAEKRYTAAAVEFYQRYVSQSQQPESSLELAKILARNGQLEQALALCERAWRTCPPETVGNAALAVLHEAPASEQQLQRVERWLEAALRQNPSLLALHVCLADLRDLQGRYREAQDLYRSILQQDDNNVFALNNLAWLLAYEGKGEEALMWINRAIENQGAFPVLLDTRAITYLALGRTDLAIVDLEAIVVDPTTETRVLAAFCFHLARAYQLAGNGEKAAAQFRKAKASGLRPENLHALEREFYRQLQTELEPR